MVNKNENAQEPLEVVETKQPEEKFDNIKMSLDPLHKLHNKTNKMLGYILNIIAKLHKDFKLKLVSICDEKTTDAAVTMISLTTIDYKCRFDFEIITTTDEDDIDKTYNVSIVDRSNTEILKFSITNPSTRNTVILDNLIKIYGK